MRRALERIEIPREHEAREHAWTLVAAAYAERERVPRRRSRVVPLAVGAALAIALGAALSAPGRAVLDDVRDAVLPTRVERAEPALFSLPSYGRLLVVSAEGGGVWVVRADGSKRRLGDYEDAVWSPNARFIAATRRHALLALTPDGDERWSLARHDVHSPAWGGTRLDTRVAYVARSGIRVVAGDGTGDRLIAPAEQGPLAWRPGRSHRLAYVSAGEVRLVAETGRVLWRSNSKSASPAQGLSWSSDGQRLLVHFARHLIVLDGRGRRVRRIDFPRSQIVAASYEPRGHAAAALLRAPGTVTAATKTRVVLLHPDLGQGARELFTGRGDFGELAWAPTGGTVLVAWRSADRWLFIRRARPFAIAVDHISAQFPRPDGRPPLLLVSDRWCCAP